MVTVTSMILMGDPKGVTHPRWKKGEGPVLVSGIGL